MPLIYIDIGQRAEERKKDYEKRRKTMAESKNSSNNNHNNIGKIQTITTSI